MMDGARILHTALQELADYIKAEIRKRVEAYGVNPRVGRNTLSDSELIRSLRVSVTSNGVEVSINDYWEYVSIGWHKTGRFPNTFGSFISNLIDWIRKKGIRWDGRTENQMAWAIAKNIFNNGIVSRPFLVYDQDGDLTKMIPSLDVYIDTWFENLFDLIMIDLDNFFSE